MYIRIVFYIILHWSVEKPEFYNPNWVNLICRVKKLWGGKG